MLCEMMAVPKFTHNYKATRDGVDAVDAASDLYTPSQLPSSLSLPLPAGTSRQFMRMIYASVRAGGQAVRPLWAWHGVL